MLTYRWCSYLRIGAIIGGILRTTLQWKDNSNYELTLAIAVEMNEFSEDESLLLFGEISGRKVWQVIY